MSVKNFIPEIWSSNILRGLLDNLVYAQVANRSYEGEIRAMGDVVHINEIGPITIRDYTDNSTSDITVEYLEDASKELRIDKAKYFAFKIDDVDKRQASGNIMDEAQTRAMWGLRNAIDEGLAALYSEALKTIGSSGSGEDTPTSAVLYQLTAIQHSLDETNTPEGGRWIVVPPWYAWKARMANIITMTDNNLGHITNGYLGRTIMGLDMYVSNNVPGGTPAGDNAMIMAGGPDTLALAVQILNVEAVRPSKGFHDLVKGLVVYGYKVIRPKNLVCMTADYVAETT
jgi:hypothetical protein